MPVNNQLYKSVVPMRNDATTTYLRNRIAPINADGLYTTIGGKKVLKSSLNQREQFISKPTNTTESKQSKKIAEDKIVTKERLYKFAEEQRIDKERELKVAPYAAMGLVGAATGTLPAMIGGEIGGQAVEQISQKTTGKSFGENILPEAPAIGSLLNPGYVIGGGISQIGSNIYRNIKPENLKKLVYNNITPAGYTNKSSEFRQLAKDIAFKKTIEINPQRDSRFYGSADFYGLDVEDAIQNREEAFRKYLGLEKETDNLYVPNKDGTFKYNDKRLTEKAKDNFVGQSQEIASDFLTSNGGGVGNIKVIDSNWPHVKYAQMEDRWDLQPFKEANRSALPSWTRKLDLEKGELIYKKWVPEKLKNLEIGETLKVGKPFTVKHSEPYMFKIDAAKYNKHIASEVANDLSTSYQRTSLPENFDYILYKKEYDKLDDKLINNLKINNIDYSKYRTVTKNNNKQ